MFLIRKMEEQDVEQVVALEHASFSQPWSQKSFLEILSIPYRIYFVAINDDKVIGGCMLSDIAGEGEITNVAVYDAYRGQGIATKLLEVLFQEGADRSITDYTLEVRAGNQPAIHLYQKFGFQTEGIRKNFYERPVEDALIMWKRPEQP